MDTDKVLLEQFIANYPTRAAQAIESLEDKEIAAFMEVMPVALNVKLISQVQAYKSARCLQLVKPVLAKTLIEQMDVAEAESLLRHCDISFRNQLLNSIQPRQANLLSQKLKYRADTVGACMTPRVFALSKEMLVGEAIEMVKLEIEHISEVIYVINEVDNLEGNIKLSELFFADHTKQLAAIMNTEIPKFSADIPVKSIQDHTAWYKYLAIPVIDRSGKLIGILDVESCQKNNTKVNNELNKEILETSSALGELYRIGLTGFLQSLSK